MLGLIFYIW